MTRRLIRVTALALGPRESVAPTRRPGPPPGPPPGPDQRQAYRETRAAFNTWRRLTRWP
jgi:hypothetical protein